MIDVNIVRQVVPQLGSFHSGFYSVADQFDKKDILELLPVCRVIFTGHSLGGAVAAIAAVLMLAHPSFPRDCVSRFGCITFGAPAFGDQSVATWVREHHFEHVFQRFYHPSDPVPSPVVGSVGGIVSTVASMGASYFLWKAFASPSASPAPAASNASPASRDTTAVPAATVAPAPTTTTVPAAPTTTPGPAGALAATTSAATTATPALTTASASTTTTVASAASPAAILGNLALSAVCVGVAGSTTAFVHFGQAQPLTAESPAGMSPVDYHRLAYYFRRLAPSVPLVMPSQIRVALTDSMQPAPAPSPPPPAVAGASVQQANANMISLPTQPKPENPEKRRPSDQLLLRAAAFGDLDECENLLVNFDASVAVRGPNNTTCLHVAVERRDLEMMKYFIDHGIDVNAKELDESGGNTPLLIAMKQENRPAIDLLLDSGADPSIPDGAKSTPLHVAAMHGMTDIAELLIKRGANVEALDSADRSPYYWANLYHHEDIVKMLPVIPYDWVKAQDAHIRDLRARGILPPPPPPDDGKKKKKKKK
ncbi:hypothetical protein PAPYR_3432 [Paratrimastix pyriformis]|uniref:Fungal lipase-type domain-containing protein n=1 Tax=Paratrimastix pyriformis TaxID=342808 RepID=A0ABQ8UPL2_9EUKA|nr:hypothetical protein PAPYR_3432 [Paratrimastix pyriformis]